CAGRLLMMEHEVKSFLIIKERLTVIRTASCRTLYECQRPGYMRLGVAFRPAVDLSA
ncbi:hypothetical protein DFO77_1621, partial [Marinilabilia salmonicolor]